MAAALKTRLLEADAQALELAAQILRNGQIVAFPTETVYGLGADALDVQAVEKIFAAKGRPQDNPLIVHVSSMNMVDQVAARISPNTKALMEAFWPGPLSIIVPKSSAIPSVVSAGLDTVAMRMPSNTVARSLIEKVNRPLAAPSANTSGRPSPTSAQHVWADLHGKIPLIVDGGRCSVGVESTVIDMSNSTPTILRPGHITLDQIQEVLPDAVEHAGSVDPEQTPSSPGMKYRHYAPKAALTVYEGNGDAVAKTIVDRYYEEMENGVRPLILCSKRDGVRYAGLAVRTLGQGALESEQALFYELRRADAEGTDVIYFHFQDDMGLAVRNRIMKAAAWKSREGI